MREIEYFVNKIMYVYLDVLHGGAFGGIDNKHSLDKALAFYN